MNATVPVLQIRPGCGLAGLPFGTSRDEVRAFFGDPSSSDQSPIGLGADQWLGVTAHFGTVEHLQALELSSPRHFTLDGTMISAIEFEVVVAFLRDLDEQTLSLPDATHFRRLSMTVCRTEGSPAGGTSIVLDREDGGDWWSGA